MSREDQRLTLTGSALAGLLGQHIGGTEPTYDSDAGFAEAALSAVKIADLTMQALGARVVDASAQEQLEECWAFLGRLIASSSAWTPEAKALLRTQKGESDA